MKCHHHFARLAFAIAVSSATVLPAHADIIALDSTRPNGNQNWTGPLGMDFDVIAPIWISKLGAYDGLPVGFGSEITVGIFNRTTGTLVGPSVVLTTANTTAEGGFNRFADIADFILGPGQYSIVADGYSTAEANGNTGLGGSGPTINTGGGLIAFTGSARFGGSGDGFSYPGIIDGGPANRYDAGTFQFRAVAVPEPGTMALAAIGLIGLGMGSRRKHR